MGSDRWIIGYTKSKVGITDGNVQGHPATLCHLVSTQSSASFTTSPTTEYIKWYDTVSTDTSEHVMINVGSTASPYEPYQGQSHELNLGKNLFDNSKRATGSASVEPIINGVCAIQLSDGNYKFACIPVMDATKYIGKTMTFSCVAKSSGTNSPQVNIVSCNANGDNRTVIQTVTGASMSYTFTVPSLTSPNNYIGFAFYSTGAVSSTTNNYINYTNVQLEFGTKTDYAPYITPIELNKIGDYQDYFIKKNGNWYIHKEIGRITFNGSETWSSGGTNTSGYARFTNSDIASLVKLPSGNSIIADIKCDHYKPISADSSYQRVQGIAINTSGVIQIFDNTYATQSASNYKIWLGSNNITVRYALATPIDEPITDTTLIYQLDNLQRAKSYYPETNITTETDNLEPIIEVKALEKLD